MTTRHVSAETAYPFEPGLTDAEMTIVGGLLDIYVVVQSPPDRVLPGSSSSSAGACEVVDRALLLVRYEVIGAATRFTFEAREGEEYWDIIFDVPNTGGVTGSVNNTSPSTVQAVLLYNSDNVIDTGSGAVDLLVEPSRTQYHTEQVDSICFWNIARCGGSENSGTLYPVLCVEGSSLSELRVEDGYNCEVEFSSSELVFTGRLSAGKGLSPDFGDTEPSCSEEPAELLDEIITTVNGISPVNGDIPVAVSADLGSQRETGQINIFPRF